MDVRELNDGTDRATAGAPQSPTTDITAHKRAQEKLDVARQRLEAHLNNSPLAVIECDRELRIIRWSGGAERLFGWGSDEVMGRGVLALLWAHAGDAESVREAIADMGSGKPGHTRGTHRNCCKDGTAVRCDWYNSAIYDAEGRLASVLSQVLDTTERTRTEEALRRQVELNQSYLDTVQTLIVALDADGRITMINRKGCKTLGYARDDLLGRNWFATCLPQPEGMDRVYPVFGRIMAGELDALEYYENPVRCRDGRIRLIAWHNACLTDAAGDMVGVLSSGEDITERKRAEEALLEADRRKDEFLAVLAHELRNPLAPMRNALEILKLKGSPDPTSQSARDLIERQLAHLVRLIEDLMDVGRITRGKVQLRREPVELAIILEQAAETIGPQIERAGQGFRLSLPTEPLYVDADPVRLSQVFLNLLDNACKYTGTGGTISLAAERDGDAVEIRVLDTGIGIPPEDLTHLFQMFARVGTPSGQAQNGLGIGLALARGLVEMHGGRIEARSEGLGRGSAFVVRLPVLTETPAAGPSQPIAPEIRDPATPLRILVADDNRDVVESLALLLELTGYRVDRAYDGLEAAEAAERYRPDLVLLDIGMPKLDGYEACRRIREQPWGRGMLIVALTGWGQEDDRRRSQGAGFDRHLVKPVARSDLLRLVAERQAAGA